MVASPNGSEIAHSRKLAEELMNQNEGHDGKLPLRNSRHEQFAQLVAAGKTPRDAYISAGFSAKGASTSAARLLRNAPIQTRVVTLKQAVSQAAVTRAAVDREYVLAGLKENFERAMQHQPVLDRKGKETGIYRYEGQVANRSLELIGTELGMFADRSDVSITNLSEITEALKAGRERANKAKAELQNERDNAKH